MTNYWIKLAHQGALKLAQVITYSNGKTVTRIYSDLNNLAEFELLGE